MDEQILDLGYAVMAQLVQSQDAAPVSAARLCKRLGVRMSSLQRCLAYFGDSQIAGQPGLGLLQVMQEDDRLLLNLTEKGQAQWRAWQAENADHQAGTQASE